MPNRHRKIELDILNTVYWIDDRSRTPIQYVPREEWLSPAKIPLVLDAVAAAAAAAAATSDWGDGIRVTSLIPWERTSAYWGDRIAMLHFYVWFENAEMFASLPAVSGVDTVDAWTKWLAQYGHVTWALSAPVFKNRSQDSYYITSHAPSCFFHSITIPDMEYAIRTLYAHRSYTLVNGALLAMAWQRARPGSGRAFSDALLEYFKAYDHRPYVPSRWYPFMPGHSMPLGDFPEFYAGADAQRLAAYGGARSLSQLLLEQRNGTMVTLVVRRTPWTAFPCLSDPPLGKRPRLAQHWHAWLLKGMRQRRSAAVAAQLLTNYAILHCVLPTIWHLYMCGAEDELGTRIRRGWMRRLWLDLIRRVRTHEMTTETVDEWMVWMLHAIIAHQSGWAAWRRLPPVGFFRDMLTNLPNWQPYRPGGVVETLKSCGSADANHIVRWVFQGTTRAWVQNIARIFRHDGKYHLVGTILLDRSFQRRQMGHVL